MPGSVFGGADRSSEATEAELRLRDQRWTPLLNYTLSRDTSSVTLITTTCYCVTGGSRGYSGHPHRLKSTKIHSFSRYKMKIKQLFWVRPAWRVGPMPRVPTKLKTPRIWTTIFWKRPKFTCKKTNMRRGGTCFVLEGPGSSHRALIRLAGPWYVLWRP